MPIIKIDGKGRTPLYINGKGRHIPHGSDEPVTDGELQQLRDSNVNFTLIDEKKGGKIKSDEDGPAVTQPPGGDFLGGSKPVEVTTTTKPAPSNQKPGGDALTPSHPAEQDEADAKAAADKAALEAASDEADAKAKAKAETAKKKV